MCLQTTRLLISQLAIYTGRSASAETKDGGAGVIVTCGHPADPIILHRSHLRVAAFAESFAEEAAAKLRALKWTTANHPDHTLTISADSQSLFKAVRLQWLTT